MTSRTQTIKKVTWVGTIIDFLLSIAKLVVGFIGQSPALIADGIHSFSDLVTDFMILVIVKYAHQDPDEDHPYGHARYETLGTAFLGVSLLAVAIGIAYANIQTFIAGGSNNSPSLLVLATVIVSLAAKEWLFHYTMKYAKITNSTLLQGNAWHSRSDALSSLVVLIGVGLNFFGWSYGEPIAAVGVAILIGKMGFELLYNSLQDLADRGVDPELQKQFKQTIESIDGVDSVHMLRSRLMANSIMIDAHIQVGSYISVSEGHQIGDWVAKTLRKQHSELEDITIHIDHEDDLDGDNPALAPLRPVIEQTLEECSIPAPWELRLHYQQSSNIVVQLFFKEQVVLPEDYELKIKQKLSNVISVECFTVTSL